jgi:hypothetical protein
MRSITPTYAYDLRKSGLTSRDYKTITLDRPGRHNRPQVAESAAVTLTSYPGTVRQLVITGLGRDAPSSSPTNTTSRPRP